MRPASEIREAARRAAWDAATAHARGLVTRHDIERRLVPLGVGRQAAAYTVKNMVKAGELRPEAPVRLQGLPRAVMGYRPALAGACEGLVQPAQPVLGVAVRAWVAAR